MKKMLICAALATVLALPAVVRAEDPQVEKGMQVYAAQKCSMCHSVAGKGNAKGSLDGVGSKLTAAEIKQWLTDPAAMTAKTKATRKPPMKVKPMPAGDVDALVAYLATLKKK
jgi:mono/diheme cytochrome c family protein